MLLNFKISILLEICHFRSVFFVFLPPGSGSTASMQIMIRIQEAFQNCRSGSESLLKVEALCSDWWGLQMQ